MMNFTYLEHINTTIQNPDKLFTYCQMNIELE